MVKFTEGAWLVVVLFPILWFAFIRLNREYTMEAEVLERVGSRRKPPEQPNYPRRTVYLLVDSFDLATMAAVRYARSLRPTTLRAVHFVIDTEQADQLREEWMRGERDIVLDFIDTPDRRLNKAAAELVSREAAVPGTHVTAVLPRRSYSPLLGRLLHDRTADKIAAVVSHIPNAAATIVPFDVRSRLEVLHERQLQRERESAGRVPGDGQAAPGAASGTTPAVAGADAARPDGAAGRGTGDGPPGAPGETHGIGATDGAEDLPPVLAEPPPSPLRNLLRRRRPPPDGEPAAAPAGGDRAGQDNATYNRPGSPARGEPDRVADQAGPGHRGGTGPRGRDPAGGAELGARRRDLRRHRRPDRPVLRPLPHPGPDMRGAGPLPRRGRDPQRPPGDDQSGLRAPRARRRVPAGRGTILTARPRARRRR